jgi:hypothetical protein
MSDGRATESRADAEAVVRRLVEEVMNQRRLELLPELYDTALVGAATRWIGSFLGSFTDVRMRVVELVVDGDRVVARFSCSGTHTGPWLGRAATGRRFHDVAEVYFFTVRGGRITEAWGLEDTLRRLRQLGLAS